MAYVRLENGAADTVMRLNRKVWDRLGGTRPTYEETVEVICGSLTEAEIDELVERYNAKQLEAKSRVAS